LSILKFVFLQNSTDGKVKLKKFYLLTLILLIEKDATFLSLTSRYGKFNQENMYQIFIRIGLVL